MADGKTTGQPAPTPAAGGQLDLVARLGAQKSKFKAAAKTLTTERDSLRTENERLKAELATATTKADTSASAKRVLELEGKLRDIAHKGKFAELARAKGAHADSIDDLWTLSGYKAAADEIDEAAMGALIDEQRGKRGYLFGKADGTGTGTTPTSTPAPIVKPGPGSGQGGHHQAPYTLSDAQQSDVKYVWNNFDKIAEAASQRVQSGQI